MPGHKAFGCTNDRKFDTSNIADMTPEDAWELMRKASEERDMDDFRDVRMPYSVMTLTMTD